MHVLVIIVNIDNMHGEKLKKPCVYIRVYIYIYMCVCVWGGAGSSFGIATDYGLDGLGSNPGGDEIFRLSLLPCLKAGACAVLRLLFVEI